MQEQIFDLLMKKEEVSWRTIIYDLVRTEQMNPWDVNLTLLTKKYIDLIKEMQEHDLQISGKVLLAAAILLKLKSSHLLEKDIPHFDALMNPEELDEEEFEELIGGRRKIDREQFKLIPRNPQPRNRKVSVNDLVKALEKAMSSRRRYLERNKPVKFKRPPKSVDIVQVIKEIYNKITYYTKKDKKKLTFSRLLPPRAGKLEKVHTFVPLLHLENQHKVETRQKVPFDEIYIRLMKGK